MTEDTIVFIDPDTMNVGELTRAQVHRLIAKLHIRLADLADVCVCEEPIVNEGAIENEEDAKELAEEIIDTIFSDDFNYSSIEDDIFVSEFSRSINNVRFGLRYDPKKRDVPLGKYCNNTVYLSMIVGIYESLKFKEFTKDKLCITIMLLEKDKGKHVNDDRETLERHLTSAGNIYLNFLRNTGCIVKTIHDRYTFSASPIDVFQIGIESPKESTTGGDFPYYRDEE